MTKEPMDLPIIGMVDTCPVCGYTDGFHVSFNKKDDQVGIVLICPNCHQRLRSGWNIRV